MAREKRGICQIIWLFKMKFNSKFNQEMVNKHYKNEIKKGTNFYGSKASQIERFKNSLRYFNFKDKYLLDVGCGKGDFPIFLNQNTEYFSRKRNGYPSQIFFLSHNIAFLQNTAALSGKSISSATHAGIILLDLDV